jgi:hypothetical protein
LPRLAVSSHSDAQILVLNAKLDVIHRGVGQIDVTLDRGLYKIKIARGGGTVEQLLDLDSDKQLFLFVDKFPAIAPIGPMLGADGPAVESLAGDALAHSAIGEPGLLIVGHHPMQPNIRPHPLDGLRVMPWPADGRVYPIDENSTIVRPVGNEWWGAIWLPSPVGCNLLEISDGTQTVRQVVPIAPNWQTRVFLTRRNWRHGADTTSETDAARSEWIDLSIQMSRPGLPVVYFDHYETIEVARNALTSTQPIFASREMINNLLYGKYDNPIVGITGLHLYLEAAERAQDPRDDSVSSRQLEIEPNGDPKDVAREVLANLETLLGQPSALVSDLMALNVRAGLLPSDATVTITDPPMFWVSWDILRSHAGRDGPIWVDPRLWNAIANSTAWGPYLVWQPGQTSWQEYSRRHVPDRQLPIEHGARLESFAVNSPLGTSPTNKRSLPILDEAELAETLGVPFSVTTGAAGAKKIFEVASPAMRGDVFGPFVKVSPAADTIMHVGNQKFPRGEEMAHPIQFGLTPEKISNWLQNLERFDPDLAKSINARTAAMQPAARRTVGLEAAVAEATPPLDVPITIETMVRPGRPVVPIKGDTVVGTPAFIEPPDGEMMVQRLLAAADHIKPVIPLVGRIDVANFPRNASFIGTGWLIAPDIVVTNSHVAELIGRRDGRRFTFLPGRFGDPIVTTLNWKHEMDSDSSVASPVESIMFIESRQVADIAFLKIGRRSDGARQDRILLADIDAAAGTSVAVIGYPARAGEDVIPDQAWMERVFGGRYDVKRAAPGVVMPNSRGWATHDCTTLGGNSGSAVIDLATGKAVALHFAGAYVLENYAVPASTIRKYLKRRPWETPETVVTDRGSGQATARVTQAPPQAAMAATGQAASVSITLPLTITVSIGSPIAGGGIAQATTTATETAPIEDAVRRFAAAFRGDGILAIRSGLVVRNGEFTDTACVNVVTHSDKIAAVRARVPAAYLGHPVDVRTAGIVDMLGGPDLVSEAAVTSIAYNDDDRTGANFSFGQVNEEMELTCCVGPERSWSVLSGYIANVKGRMVSSMYQFHAEHVADAIQERLENGITMELALDKATRVTKAGVGDGDFNRKTVFGKWARDFSFDRIYVPQGSNGLIADSYHIKVTVDDDDRFWLSSGNWKNSSQPNIDLADLNDLQAIRAKKGNREWHVVIKNKTLATRYRSHILADLEFSKENGGTEEAVVEDVLVDVPVAIEESVAFELEARAASRIFDPITINRRVKVKPLLTPDKRGKVYTDAVLDLIESADDELLFQIPYINSFKENAAGNLEKLVEALIRKSKEIDTVRIILRSDHGSWIPCAEDLKKRGLNLNKCLRHLPSTHTKGMIVDGRRCLVGSHNWSGNGVTLNRDASLLFDDTDVAQYFRQAFELDWDRASRPVIPESAITETPRIADPESAVPPGFRRMTLEEFLEG